MSFDPRHTQKGSALIVILIGVALFGTLSFVVANMLRSGSSENLTKEKSQLAAAEILEFSGGVRRAVQEMRISNSCSETDISFEATGLTGYAHTPAVSDACKIFTTTGGGITYVAPQEDWLDSAQSAAATYGDYAMVRKMAINSIGTTATELMLVLNYVRDEICMEINTHLGITNAASAPPADIDAFEPTDLFIGVYGTTTEPVNGTEFIGKSAGCVQTSDGAYNSFYQVLIPR